MSKHSRSKTVWRVILAIVSVLVIVALATVAVIYRPTWIHADSPVTQRSSVSRYRQSASAGNILSSTNDDS